MYLVPLGIMMSPFALLKAQYNISPFFEYKRLSLILQYGLCSSNSIPSDTFKLLNK